MLLDTCREIAENPNIGKNYEEIANRLFGLRTGRHIIFYRNISVQEVEITRILHEQMELNSRLMK